MMPIDYPHSKKLTIKNLWNLKIKIIKILLNRILSFQEYFTTCQWGVMYTTSKAKLYFMIQEKKS